MEDTLKEALKVAATLKSPLGEGPHTAALLDEEDPQGPVVLYDKSGCARALMPRDVWDSLRETDPT